MRVASFDSKTTRPTMTTPEGARCARCGLPAALSMSITTRKGQTWHADCMIAFANSLKDERPMRPGRERP
jgi:hypothetical protein